MSILPVLCMLRRSASAGFFHEARERQKRASLVETGRHAGRSRVNFGGFRGVTLNYHAWKRGACPALMLNPRREVWLTRLFRAAWLISC